MKFIETLNYKGIVIKSCNNSYKIVWTRDNH
jgi:hypothetical protein